jgi:hypothetical protein
VDRETKAPSLFGIALAGKAEGKGVWLPQSRIPWKAGWRLVIEEILAMSQEVQAFATTPQIIAAARQKVPQSV